MEDFKDIYYPSETSPGWWDQIGGDFGDPWESGGTWYNPVTQRLVHFLGIENDPEKEIEPDDIIPPARMMAKLKAKIHDPYLDTDEAKEDQEWFKRAISYEENEIERIVGNYQYARAAFLNDRVDYDFFDDTVRELSADDLNEVGSQFDPEFDKWPIAHQQAELNNYYGWDSSFKMNRLEAGRFFGFSI